jgi:DNA-binding response OmpR family regulator
MLIEIADAFSNVGAKPMGARNLKQALTALEHDNIAAAVLDHLPGEDSSILCERLEEMKVPFVIYSGRDSLNGHCATGIFIAKPASVEQLIATVEKLAG